MNSNELYHYGVTGMRWGKRKKLSSNKKYQSNKTSNEERRKRNIAIGTAASATILAGIGTMLASNAVKNNRLMSITAKALRDNM